MSEDRPTQVVVDGFELNTIDAAGVAWRFQKISGWHEPVRVDVIQEQRSTVPGQFGQIGHRQGRLIGVTGRILAPRDLMPTAIDQLNAILADGGFGKFQFFDRVQGERWTTVQLGPNSVRADEWLGGPVFPFQLELLAPESYKYGDTSSSSAVFASDPVGSGLVFDLFPSGVLDFGAAASSGVVTLSNPGTAEASVKFTVAGPTPPGGFVITDATTGKTITYLGDVPTGSVLVLDGSDGSVVIDNSADRSGDTVVQAWPTIAAGTSRDFLFTPLGGTSAAVLTGECIATYW